ncbi:MAG: trypsin-like peptidase domain-containing protein [Dehalococcoidia bacterium]|nr:trypsin-like peptidase domain-containing protein [Dehalococcoidia bacterium]
MTSEPGAALALSNLLADAVDRAAAWTVRVVARRRLGATGVAWNAEGVVVTADHVIESEDDVQIGLPDGSTSRAHVVGRDPGTDLAVLRLEGATLPAADRAPEGSARVGQLALGLGRPGSSIQASLGVVSALGGQWRTRRGRQIEGFVRSDVTFFPGFSGGPLIDAGGRLIGINTSRFGPGQGIAIPAPAAARVIDILLAKGRISRAYVGIGSQPVALPAALAAKAGNQESGLLIVSVEPSSPADAAGILVGDILVGLGDAAITDAADLQAQLGPERVGEAVPLRVLRGGEPLERSVTLGERA